MGLRFGNFEVDTTSREMRKSGFKVHIQEQPFRVLAALLRRAGAMVSRDDLRQELWPADTFVDFDRGLNNAIRRLRRVLGDSAESPRFVETMAGRGYRFIAPVVTLVLPPTNLEPTPKSAICKSEAASAPRRVWMRRACALLAAVVLGVAVIALVGRLRYGFPEGRPAKGKLMLAILPFENLSGDANNDYLSDGLTEELISHLGHTGTNQLNVIGRTSVMRYKHTSKRIGQIGHELGADLILEGSLRLGDRRARVTMRLIRVNEGTTRWTTTLERDAADVLHLQTAVAGAVAKELQLHLASVPPLHKNVEAYQQWLKGKEAWNRRTGPDLKQAIAHFESASAVDPSFALPYVGMADAWSLLPYYAGLPPAAAFSKARMMAQRALKLDARLAEAHTSLAYVAHRYDWDWTEAENRYRLAIALNPSYSIAHHWYAELLLT